MRRSLTLCLLALLAPPALAQKSVPGTPNGSPHAALKRTFDERVAPNLIGTSGLTLEQLTTLVTQWVQDVRRANITTLEREVERAVNAVERLAQHEANRLSEKCREREGADVAWRYLRDHPFILKPGLAGDLSSVRSAVERCLTFEVILRSEMKFRHDDMDVVITTGVEAIVPIRMDLATGKGSGSAPLAWTTVHFAFTNGCAATGLVTTNGMLRVDGFGAHTGQAGNPLAGEFSVYDFEYAVAAPLLSTNMTCGPHTVPVPMPPETLWAFPYRLAHEDELRSGGTVYATPLNPFPQPIGSILQEWTYRRAVPKMNAASEFTVLKVRHTPR